MRRDKTPDSSNHGCVCIVPERVCGLRFDRFRLFRQGKRLRAEEGMMNFTR